MVHKNAGGRSHRFPNQVLDNLPNAAHELSPRHARHGGEKKKEKIKDPFKTPGETKRDTTKRGG